MSPFLTHLRFSRGAIIAWGLVVMAFGFVVMYFYPSVREQGEAFLRYMESLPEQLLAAFGLAEQEWRLGAGATALGLEAYLTSQYLVLLPLLVGIYALFYGSGLVSREVERGTLELLLSFPLSRHRVVLTKFLVFALAAALLMAASVAGLLLGMPVVGERVDLTDLLLVHLVAYLLAVAIAAYSTLASCLYFSPHKALMVAGLFTAASYILYFMSPSLGSLEGLKRLSLFYYYQPLFILVRGEVNWAGVALYLAATAAALLAALVIFSRKDILPE